MFQTTVAGSLPKPAWLAEPNKLWAPWRLEGEALAEAKRDATLLALKVQEAAEIDIVTDGEQSRQHFVHGFLEQIEGIDLSRRGGVGTPGHPFPRPGPGRGRPGPSPSRDSCRRSALGAGTYPPQAKVHHPGADDHRR